MQVRIRNAVTGVWKCLTEKPILELGLNEQGTSAHIAHSLNAHNSRDWPWPKLEARRQEHGLQKYVETLNGVADLDN